MKFASLLTDPDLRAEISQERRKRKQIVIDPIYLAMCGGDLVAAAMLADVVYWHTPDDHGRLKLSVQHDGYLWIAKSNADWAADLGLTPDQIRRGRNVLEEKSLVVNKTYRFNSVPTGHTRINQTGFSMSLKKHKQEWEDGFLPTSKRKENSRATEMGSSPNGPQPKSEMGHSPNRLGPQPKSLTENTTQNTTENTEESKPELQAPQADAPQKDPVYFWVDGSYYQQQPSKPLPHIKVGRRKYYLPPKLTQEFLNWIHEYPQTNGTFVEAAQQWETMVKSGEIDAETAADILRDTRDRKRHVWNEISPKHPNRYLKKKVWENPVVKENQAVKPPKQLSYIDAQRQKNDEYFKRRMAEIQAKKQAGVNE